MTGANGLRLGLMKVFAALISTGSSGKERFRQNLARRTNIHNL
jgi:hypothetical protein